MTLSAARNPISRIDSPFISLAAVTVTGPGAEFGFSQPVRNISMQVVFTSNPSPVKVTLEGTIDGADWFTLATFDTGAGTPNANKDIVYGDNISVIGARANLVTLTGGTTPNVTATIQATL